MPGAQTGAIKKGRMAAALELRYLDCWLTWRERPPAWEPKELQEAERGRRT